MEFKLNWAYPWLWFHTIQRKSLNYFKQNLCWIIYISQIMSHEISQVWILFGGFVVLGWRCHYSTPPGRAGRAGPSATFQSGEHTPWPADKSPASRNGAYQSLDPYDTEHIRNETLLVRLPDCMFGSIGESLTITWLDTDIDNRSLKDQTPRYWTITWLVTDIDNRSRLNIYCPTLISILCELDLALMTC